MDCDKCEETGLLYASGELPVVEKTKFEGELAACPPCDKGYRRYARERNTLYPQSVLAEAPSDKTDAEIRRVCSAAKNQFTAIGLFSYYVKKSAVPVLFLVLGVGLGFYVVYTAGGWMGGSGTNATVQQQPSGAAVAAVHPANGAAASEVQQTAAASKDSLAKDGARNALPYSKRVGNTSMQGVIPVDVNK
jgi:hypothetical protein